MNDESTTMIQNEMNAHGHATDTDTQSNQIKIKTSKVLGKQHYSTPIIQSTTINEHYLL